MNALKLHPSNQTIMRDLSWLQIQMRNLEGFVETRRQLLVAAPGRKSNWIAFSAANFMNSQYESARNILNDVYKNFVEPEPGLSPSTI